MSERSRIGSINKNIIAKGVLPLDYICFDVVYIFDIVFIIYIRYVVYISDRYRYLPKPTEIPMNLYGRLDN